MSAILDERNQIDNSSKKKLRGRLTSGTVALLIALLAVISATYAWYVYNTGRHTTKVRMAAGAGVNLQISNSYNGTYGSAAVLESFSGQLNPVSTNRISGGFQKVLGGLPMVLKISPIWLQAFLEVEITVTIIKQAFF